MSNVEITLQESLPKGILTHDESCLENMRQIVKEYITHRKQQQIETDVRQLFRHRYEEYRQKMHNEVWRAFIGFELMEKLYWQEYLING